MYRIRRLLLAVLVLVPTSYAKSKISGQFNYSYSELGDHTIVTENGVFPYVVAILKKSIYISAGALIDESWVLTAADALYLLRESVRELRVRLGSINYKKGGVLLPIKFFEIHPFFKDTKPEYDLALIRLPRAVHLSNNLNPIKLQKRPRPVSASHFIVTAWPEPANFTLEKSLGPTVSGMSGETTQEAVKPPSSKEKAQLNISSISFYKQDDFKPRLRQKTSEELQQLRSMEFIKRRRILTVAHLHPSDPETCTEEIEALDINSTGMIMCLDASLGTDPCVRDVGAPVVLNNILWAIVSSYKPEDCELDSGPSFATLVASVDINSWIHATVRGHRWNQQQNRVFAEEDTVDDYDDVEAYDDTDDAD